MTAEQKKSENNLRSNWPGGWYVFNEGKVEGPYTADQTFEMDAMSREGKPILVSRKGFTQWYALKDMAEIFKITESLGKRVALEKAAVALKNAGTSSMDHQMTAVALPAESSVKPVQQTEAVVASARVQKKQVGPKLQMKATLLDYNPPAAPGPVSATPTVIKTRGSLDHTKEQQHSEAPATLLADPRERNKKELLQEYFFVRGRMRLGKIRSPWASAFFGVPMTLGLILPFWMNSLLKEIFYHSANNLKIPKWIVPLGMIPVLHLFSVHRLACLVREMEMQNRYKSISPLLATIFGIFPPFAMAYLQDGANRHWLLHARHTSGPKS